MYKLGWIRVTTNYYHNDEVAMETLCTFTDPQDNASSNTEQVLPISELSKVPFYQHGQVGDYQGFLWTLFFIQYWNAGTEI